MYVMCMSIQLYMHVYMCVPEQECMCVHGDMGVHTYICVCTRSDTHAQKTHFSPLSCIPFTPRQHSTCYVTSLSVWRLIISFLSREKEGSPASPKPQALNVVGKPPQEPTRWPMRDPREALLRDIFTDTARRGTQLVPPHSSSLEPRSSGQKVGNSTRPLEWLKRGS